MAPEPALDHDEDIRQNEILKKADHPMRGEECTCIPCPSAGSLSRWAFARHICGVVDGIRCSQSGSGVLGLVQVRPFEALYCSH